MKVWQHKKTNEIMIAYPVFVEMDNSETRDGLRFSAFQLLGLACENSHGVTIIFPESVTDHFEFIGEF